MDNDRNLRPLRATAHRIITEIVMPNACFKYLIEPILPLVTTDCAHSQHGVCRVLMLPHLYTEVQG